jgi:hypothetical protein
MRVCARTWSAQEDAGASALRLIRSLHLGCGFTMERGFWLHVGHGGVRADVRANL